MQQAGEPFEIVVPEATIFCEHPAVVVDRNVTAEERPVVNAFIQYLWSDEAQSVFVQNHFRSVTNESLNEAHKEFAQIKMPFTADTLFGGWDQAYPQVIERIWRDQVRRIR